MAEYIVKTGQNIFDVALTLYGSIEGLLDLMVNNPTLSIDSDITSGDKLQYTPYYYEDQTVIDYYQNNKIVPSNQIGDIYYKELSNVKMYLFNSRDIKTFGFKASGEGDIYIDWGDDTKIEKITLTSSLQHFQHTTLSKLTEDRKIKFSGNFKIYEFDVTNINPDKIFILAPLSMEKFTVIGAPSLADIDFFQMVDTNNMIEVSIVKSKIVDLSPLLGMKNAKSINVGYCNIKQSIIDKYLIDLVENYGIRRNCTINFIGSAIPSGVYRKPDDLKHPATGMEAIWVLVNEHKESSGPWKFILNNNIIYTI